MQRGKMPLGGKGNGELRDVSVKVSKTPSKLIEGAIYGGKNEESSISVSLTFHCFSLRVFFSLLHFQSAESFKQKLLDNFAIYDTAACPTVITVPCRGRGLLKHSRAEPHDRWQCTCHLANGYNGLAAKSRGAISILGSEFSFSEPAIFPLCLVVSIDLAWPVCQKGIPNM